MRIEIDGNREAACQLARRLGRTLARPASEKELDAAEARLELIRLRQVRDSVEGVQNAR